MSESHNTISLVRMTYLSYVDNRAPARQIQTESPLAEYSAQYWVDHARSSETDNDVQGTILDFFLQKRQAYNTWLSLFDPDQPCSGGSQVYGKMATFLYYASLGGLQRIVELLVKEGANANAQDKRHGSALQVSSFKGVIRQ